jgi:hypothetical protein
LTPEAGERPNEVAYRLRILRETPGAVSTVVGDVLHNLRSALDSLAYGLAVQPEGKTLTRKEERVTTFPWVASSSEYEDFFGTDVSTRKRDDASRLRRRIYSPQARAAMRIVQPFYWAEQSHASETERQRRSGDDFEYSPIRRLSHLNNIDKHRRLPVVSVGWPGMIYWGSDEVDNTRFLWGHWPPADNTILFYLVGSSAAKRKLQHELRLVLTDDPIHQPVIGKPYQPPDCRGLLGGFAREVDITLRQVLWRYNKELKGDHYREMSPSAN